MNRGAWQAIVYGIAKNQPRLRLNMYTWLMVRNEGILRSQPGLPVKDLVTMTSLPFGQGPQIGESEKQSNV